MSANNMDELFRKKLAGIEVPEFDPGHWQEAKQMLNSSQGKKPRFLWTGLVIGIVGLGVLTYMLISGEPGQPLTSPVGEHATPENLVEGTVKNTEGLILQSDRPKAGTTTYQKVEGKDLTSGNTESFDEQEDKGQDLFKNPPKSFSPARVMREEKWENPTLASGQDITSASGDVRRELVKRKAVTLNGIPSMSTKSLPYYYTLDQRDREKVQSGITAEKYRKYRIGLTGSILFGDRAIGGTSLSGFVLGPTLEYYLRPWLYVGSRPSLEILLNQNGLSKFQQSVSYGFSAQDEIYGLQANSLQFIRLPLFVGWVKGQHTLESGMAVDWLLAARGVLQELDLESQNIEIVRELSEGWIEINDMQKVIPSAFLGYRFAWNQQINLGINLNCQLSNLYPSLPTTGPFSNPARWYIGIQGTYYFKQ